ncbi:hypothetical protein VB620_00130 [Nodularia harveyana UHCC-0300]|uniref:Uncharacterized protein n=1 Tax=Nodularia harveyana UHCC-0300 TaxID=2974287 RepID=A0ABU5U886_9CYAN|nr:hypothetical protein [Nodularia harveyana]MEA5579743.1 hypothetical protein [Nodularia harveyana UHCC-0300]
MEYSYFGDDSPHEWVKVPVTANYDTSMPMAICGAIALQLFDMIPIVYQIFIGLCYLYQNLGK